MENPPIVVPEAGANSRKADANANKQRWLRAWEESAFTKDTQAERHQTEGGRSDDSPQLPYEWINNGHFERGNASLFSDPSPVDFIQQDEFAQEAKRPIEIRNESQQGRPSLQGRESTPWPLSQKTPNSTVRSNVYGVTPKLLEQKVRLAIPDINVQVLVAGEKVTVRVRDFRRDALSLHALIEKLKQVVDAVGLQLGTLTVNGRDIVSMSQGE